MMSFSKIRSDIQGKITGPWNIGHSDLQIDEVIHSVRQNKYPKYDLLFDTVRDTRQNH